jgi:UDP-glucose 4-epimerase
MSYKLRSIVTGGAGFIGSHLVDELLNMKHEVVVLDNFSTGRKQNLEHVSDKIKLIECDLSIKGDWIKEFDGVDWVFHLASLADIVPSIQNPEGYFRSNVDATFYVLEAARHANVKRFIYSASSSCYGIPDKFPTSEESDIQPQYPYALAKRMGEEMVEHWAQLYNLPAISLRFFNVYGTRSRTSGTYGAVFGVFLAQKIPNKPYTVVGDGNQTRDFTYVTDIVSALIVAAKSHLTNKIYNVGSDATVSINKIVELLGGDKVNIPKRPGEPDCTYADISKIKDDLGWKPTISIEEGVDRILESINYWKEATVWEPESIANATSDWFKYLDK